MARTKQKARSKYSSSIGNQEFEIEEPYTDPALRPAAGVKTAHELYEEWCTFLREKASEEVKWPETPKSSKDKDGKHPRNALRTLRVLFDSL
jgi:hypothetical protein